MDLQAAVQGRRSIRRFKPEPIPQESLDAILEGVRWSPSWGNTQCWEVVIVKDPALKEKLEASLIKPNSAVKTMIETPVVLALCGKLASSGYYHGKASTRWGDWILFDCGIAAQNLCLMAHSLGLGTVIIGLFDHQAVEKALAVPEGYSVVCLVPVGYPALTPKATSRKQISAFTHQETYKK